MVRKISHLRRPFIALVVGALIAGGALFGTHGTSSAASLAKGKLNPPPGNSQPAPPGTISPTSITWD